MLNRKHVFTLFWQSVVSTATDLQVQQRQQSKWFLNQHIYTFYSIFINFWVNLSQFVASVWVQKGCRLLPQWCWRAAHSPAPVLALDVPRSPWPSPVPDGVLCAPPPPSAGPPPPTAVSGWLPVTTQNRTTRSGQSLFNTGPVLISTATAWPMQVQFSM